MPSSQPIELAEQHVAAGQFSDAIRALQTLGADGTREDYRALAKVAAEIRERTSKGREQNQAAALMAHAEQTIWRLDDPAAAIVVPDTRFRDGIPISTANDVPGWKVTGYIGEVFGLVVRSRGAFPQMGANLKSIIGGELKTMTNLLRDARKEAIARLVEEAEARGADAVIAMRFDVTSMGETTGWTEICAYGTAVRATKVVEQSPVE